MNNIINTKVIVDPEGINYEISVSNRVAKEYLVETRGQELSPQERVRVVMGLLTDQKLAKDLTEEVLNEHK